MNDPVTLNSVKACFYTPTSHGITLTITGKKPTHLTVNSLKMNVYGDIWKALPSGLETIVRWSFLPLELCPDYMKPSCFKSGDKDFCAQINLATKTGGTPGVSHATIKTRLNEQVQAKDPIFQLEFTTPSNDTPLFSIVTRPSLLQKALESKDGGSILYTGPTPNFPKPSPIWSILRWYFLPTLFCLSVWSLLLVPGTLTDVFPVMFGADHNITVTSLLPPHPTTMHQAFLLGRLDHRLTVQETTSGGPPNIIREILTEAAEVVGRSLPLLPGELHGVENRILEIEEHRGILQRVLGLFTFVNLVWLLAILGISISIGPVIYHVLQPLRHLMLRLAKWILNKIILPLHNIGVFELLAYLLCITFCVEGVRHPPERGFFITLTGLALALPSYAYSTFLHAKVKKGSEETIWSVTCLWAATCWIPMGVWYHSTLIGWLTVLAVYNVLGFSMACYGLCYVVGFKDKEALVRVGVTSALLLIWGGGVRALMVEPEILVPFGSAVMILGSVTLLLALLIYSSLFYHDSYNISYNYGKRQIPIFFVLFLEIFFGNIFGLEGMVNSSYVFLVLYFVEKYVELHVDRKWNGWLLLMVMSLFLYKAALFLHVNPQYVTGLFDPGL